MWRTNEGPLLNLFLLLITTNYFSIVPLCNYIKATSLRSWCVAFLQVVELLTCITSLYFGLVFTPTVKFLQKPRLAPPSPPLERAPGVGDRGNQQLAEGTFYISSCQHISIYNSLGPSCTPFPDLYTFTKEKGDTSSKTQTQTCINIIIIITEVCFERKVMLCGLP